MFFPRLLQDYLYLSSKHYPHKNAIICGQNRITYFELHLSSDILSYELFKLGIKRHDRVIIFLNNSIETVISLFGILKAGATFIILNDSIKSNNLQYILKDSGALVLITDTRKAQVVKDAIDSSFTSPGIIWIGNNNEIPEHFSKMSTIWDDLNLLHRDNLDTNLKAKPVSIDLDLAALIYTSGSTGRSKGVMSPHQSMVAAAKSIIQYLRNTPDDIILCVLPLSFDYGLYQVIMSVIFGGTVVLETNFLFIHSVLKTIEKHNVTGFPIVPTLLAMLLNIEHLSKYDFSSLRYITNTGAALPVYHIRKIRKVLPDVQIYSMFGLTECKRILYLPPEEIDAYPDSVGKAMPNCEVFVVNEDGNEVADGETGELVVRGANLMKGYWNDPELTEKWYHPGKFPGEKLLYTGDYFKKDKDGYLYFIGRKDEMIKCKGERVSPREIEETICEMNSVSESAVIGIEDKISGQAIKAFVIPVTGKKLTENNVKKYCSQRLENFKIPKLVEIAKTLPKTANGKIDKKSLKLT